MVDSILIATGRAPNVENMGLEKAGSVVSSRAQETTLS